MSGISSASYDTTTGGGGTGPESFHVSWNGVNPYHMSAASGTTANVINAVVSNGSGDCSYTWTVTSNPSGKLSLSAGSGSSNRRIAWSGFVISETESIAVQIDVVDNVTSFTGSDSITISINRNG